jgi:hypothetical protein
MSTGYSQQVPVSIDDIEIMLDVTYSYSPGAPEQGPSYASGGQPAEAAEIEITSIKVKGTEVPLWFWAAVIAGDTVHEWLSEHHDGDEDDGSDRDYDRDRDERLTDEH